MADFNQVLTPGAVDDGTVTAVIEIPEGSILKIEYHRQTATFELDRVEPNIFPKPASYGFIPQTLDEDDDELDILIVCKEPIPTGVHLKARIIGVMYFEDDDEKDDKIVAVPADDRDRGNSISDFDHLGERWKEKVEFHFNHYKDLKKPGSTKVLGWGNESDAKRIIKECIERYKKQK